MVPISVVDGIQIDITNICHLSCVYCTRYIAHLRKDQRKSMTVDQIGKALDSLQGWHESGISRRGVPHWIGIIGGEPTLHPQFEQVCEEIRKRYPKRAFNTVGAVGLWSTGNTPQFHKYRTLIDETFGFLILNPHDETQVQVCKHQPISVAIEEVVKDVEMREFLISHCWVQRQWCPTINHFGAYFCEVAAALDVLLNEGKHAWPVEPGWWQRLPEADGKYGIQSDACNKCGMAIPMERELLKSTVTKFSPELLKIFRAENLRGVDPKNVEVVSKQISNEDILQKYPTWMPGNYHGDFYPDESVLPAKDYLGIHPDHHEELIRIGKKLPKVVDGQVQVEDTEW